MSSASTRQQKRAPVTLKIKFKSSTLDQFVERYSVDISQGGIFIRTKSPLEVGTPLRFEFQLKNATPLITGEGTVVWTREYDPSRTGLAPGMGVRFDRLPPESQQVLTKILEQKKARPAAARRPAAPAPGPDPSEEFVDSPTKVAPRAVIAGLADTSRETFAEDEHVPVDAFEEATKVGLLDELVAKTAEPEMAPEDEPILTSAPRSDAGPIGTAIDTVAPKRPSEPEDDAPELPMPLSASRVEDDDGGVVPPDGFGDEILDLPAPSRKRPDFPAEIPTELNLAPPPPSKSPADHAPTDPNPTPPSAAELAAARDGLDKPATLLDSVPPLPDRPPSVSPPAPSQSQEMSPRAESTGEPHSRPLAATPHLMASKDEVDVEPRGGGGSALWIAMAVGIILLAGGGFAYYTMVMKDDETTAAKRPPPPQPDTSKAVDENAGKQVEEPPTPPEPVGLEATVKSEVEGASAKLVDGDQEGPTPMTFKGLEEGKTYKVTITAPGFLPAEVEIKGGETSDPIKLDAKPRFIAVTSSPAGASVYINKRRRGKTPFELELKGSLAQLDELKVQLRRAGYDSVEKTIAKSDAWNEEDERMVASLDLKLSRRAPRANPNRNNNRVNNNSGGDGDGDKAGGDGDGDKAGGDGDGDKAGGDGDGDKAGGDGDGDKAGGDGDKSGGGEPVPDWAKDKKNDEGAKPAPKPDPAPSE